MKYYKTPRKLKKQLKKQVLASHSDSYIKYKNMRLKGIRILYYVKETGKFGIGNYQQK